MPKIMISIIIKDFFVFFYFKDNTFSINPLQTHQKNYLTIFYIFITTD